MEVPDNQFFSFVYFQTSDCSGQGLKYTGDEFLGSAVLNWCLASGPQNSRKSILKGNVLKTVIYQSTSCDGPVVDSFEGVVGACNSRFENSNSTTVYYTVQGMISASSQTLLSGQVNLNADAINLNAQIVGSSVGVICGFTALLIFISMFWTAL